MNYELWRPCSQSDVTNLWRHHSWQQGVSYSPTSRHRTVRMYCQFEMCRFTTNSVWLYNKPITLPSKIFIHDNNMYILYILLWNSSVSTAGFLTYHRYYSHHFQSTAAERTAPTNLEQIYHKTKKYYQNFTTILDEPGRSISLESRVPWPR